jgi:hypothetical protein
MSYSEWSQKIRYIITITFQHCFRINLQESQENKCLEMTEENERLVYVYDIN